MAERRLVGAARRLRKAMTPHEVKLWVHLKTLNRVHGRRFRRQAPIGPYIADFASFDPKLVIEVDGGQHNEAEHRQRDAARDAFFRAEGFRVLRVWNNEVDDNPDGVMDAIHHALTKAGSPPPALRATSPIKGED
ncbi:MAG: endonuclease domain-containing protein [Maricaulaceae bacterium]|nr:endonuclease domain-containing protein [Maricaulaceae bacterium]